MYFLQNAGAGHRGGGGGGGCKGTCPPRKGAVSNLKKFAHSIYSNGFGWFGGGLSGLGCFKDMTNFR